MIITIDGSAGSGKSTVARKLAARLGIAYLDTGAMYRAIAWVGLQQGIDFEDSAALLEIARRITLEVDCGPTHTRIRADGQDVSEAVRSLAVSEVTPYVARHAGIRALLVERQRALGRRLGSLVAEGRDQGSVVFTDADVKFVLDADPKVRAQRRLADLTADGESVKIAEVMENLIRRDQDDCVQWAPLLKSGEAIVLDTSHMELAEVVDRLVELVSDRVRAPAGLRPDADGNA
ncbi:MAG TPA: (d)CMP kinase [Phycisphaerae bacterium]|nr:(d)CMP kinase [Phycisphaerae bacterium]HNU45284.1 (d)CMP kinase [Phycisphaerae bacterium]